MTKKDILKLIDRKIKDATEISEQNHGHNTEAWSSYYCGVVQGLKDAKSIIVLRIVNASSIAVNTEFK